VRFAAQKTPALPAAVAGVMFKGKMRYTLFLTILLSGCPLFLMGDGYFSTSGELVGFEGQTCDLVLTDKYSDDLNRSRIIEGKFSHAGFTVAAKKHQYFVSVICNEKLIAKKTVNYPEDGSIEFGKLRFSQ
jgi:hypothetical protein